MLLHKSLRTKFMIFSKHDHPLLPQRRGRPLEVQHFFRWKIGFSKFDTFSKMVPTGSKRAVLGTLKPMHFSFVTLLMIFDEFDHLHLPQPRGRHGKVGTQNPIFRQNIIISKTIFSQKKGLFGHLKANAFQFCNQIYNFNKPIWPSPPPTASRGTSWIW